MTDDPKTDTDPNPIVRGLTVQDLRGILGELQAGSASLAVSAAKLTDNLHAMIWLPLYSQHVVLVKHWPYFSDHQKRWMLATVVLALQEYAKRFEEYLLADELTAPLPTWTQQDSIEVEEKAARIADAGEDGRPEHDEQWTAPERDAVVPGAEPTADAAGANPDDAAATVPE